MLCKVSISVDENSAIFNDAGNVLLFINSLKSGGYPERWVRIFIPEFLFLIAFVTSFTVVGLNNNLYCQNFSLATLNAPEHGYIFLKIVEI